MEQGLINKVKALIKAMEENYESCEEAGIDSTGSYVKQQYIADELEELKDAVNKDFKSKWNELTIREKKTVRQVYNETAATNPGIEECKKEDTETLKEWFEADFEDFEFKKA